MQAMAPAERRAALGEVRTEGRRLVLVRRTLVAVVVEGGARLVRCRDCALGRSFVRPAPAPRRVRSRQVDSAADGLFLDRADRKMRRQESPLHLGVVGEARRLAEELLVDLEPYCRLVVRCRHEDALVRRDAHAKYRRSVEIGEEDQDVGTDCGCARDTRAAPDTTDPAAAATRSRRRGCAGS